MNLKKLKNIFFKNLIKLTPSTRLYKLKALILNLAGFNVAKNARVVSSVKFIGVEHIIIGEDSFVGHESLFIGSQGTTINIGCYCDISTRVTFVTGTHYLDETGIRTAGKGYGKNITIGNGVWIGINVTILPGVTVGNNTVVAAGAVVTKDLPSNVVAAGIPAKVIRFLNAESD